MVAPKPSRESEAFNRTRQANGSTNKKPQFDARNPSALAADADEEDDVLEADTIGRGVRTKRNAAIVDGFESDSSNEGFDARAEARAKAAKQADSKDADEIDMFNDVEEEKFADGDEDETGNVSGKKRKRDVSLLDMDAIQGQSRGSKAGRRVRVNLQNPDAAEENKGEHESESSSDEDVPDEERAAADGIDKELGAGAKKRHAPKLDAFNLQDEKQDGGFDEHGNYLRKAFDPNAVYDSWLDGLSKKDMKKAREAHGQRMEDQKQKRIQNDAKTMDEILTELISRMESGETVLEALGRLGRAKEKKKSNWKDRRRMKKGIDMDVDGGDDGKTNGSESSAETERKAAIDAITEAADLLLSRGDTEIYQKDREQLVRAFAKETGEEWQDKKKTITSSSSCQWYYHWKDARDGGEPHGPYDGSTMLAWQDAGYFGEGVEFQRADDENGSWFATVEF